MAVWSLVSTAKEQNINYNGYFHKISYGDIQSMKLSFPSSKTLI